MDYNGVFIDKFQLKGLVEIDKNEKILNLNELEQMDIKKILESYCLKYDENQEKIAPWEEVVMQPKIRALNKQHKEDIYNAIKSMEDIFKKID